MGLCKVNNIDVVTKASTVLSRIIISEDAQTLAFSDSGLSDERHEIVRNATRKLADKC